MSSLEWVLGTTLVIEVVIAAWWTLVVDRYVDPFHYQGTDW
jgi:hypothetical protein